MAFSGLRPVRRNFDPTVAARFLQKEVLDRRSCASREDVRIAIVTWIESGPTTGAADSLDSGV